MRRRALLAGLGTAIPAAACAAAPPPGTGMIRSGGDVARAGEPAGGDVAWAGEPAQGALLLGRAAPGTRLALDGRDVRVGGDGRFALGFGRDAGPRAVLALRHPDGRAETRTLAVAPRPWAVQRLEGLPETMVTPPPETLARIGAERERLAALRRADSPEPHWAGGFDWPARGRISGVFGSQRVLNGQPRAPHLGLDVAAPTGTPVAAMAPGRVVLAEDLYFTGLTAIVDHGHGVASLYAHLSRLDARAGDRLGRGGAVGAIGATGRATGPHLHLGLYWFATAVDPRPLLPDA